jgi:hypothetical protein
MMDRACALLIFVLLAGACTSTNVIRAPDAPEGLAEVPVDSVRVYSDTTGMCDFQKIAGLRVSGSVKGMEDATREKAIEKTAELGGNALVVGKTIQQGATLADYAGNTISGFTAVLEDRPCDQ